MEKLAVKHGPIEPSPRKTLVVHLLAEGVLTKVLSRLTASGVVALPVKGVVTAYELYRDVTERPISDIDLRVVPQDLEQVAAVIAEAGWELLRYSKPYENIVFRVDGLCLDVEASVGPPGLCSLRVADMIARAERGGKRGYEHLRPATLDHALLLCVNAFKDKLTRAAPWAIRDVERIVLEPDFDADRFLAHAKACDALGIVAIVAEWMATERKSDAWGEIRRRIGPSPRPLYARLFRQLMRHNDNSLAIRLLARAGSDSRPQQARAILLALLWEADARRKRSTARR